MGKHTAGYLTKIWERSIHILDIDDLRDSTPVGAHILFEKTIEGGDAIYHRQQKPGIISGVIKSKFPHIFLLEDGRTFSWKDYYLGKIK